MEAEGRTAGPPFLRRSQGRAVPGHPSPPLTRVPFGWGRRRSTLTTVNAWIDSHYQRTLDFSLDIGLTRWANIGSSRRTSLYYAVQDLGQTGCAKYVDIDTNWCSEFASWALRHTGLETPKGSITINDLSAWFSEHERKYAPWEVGHGLRYLIQPGDYVALWPTSDHPEGIHSVLFVRWVEIPKIPNPDATFWTIEGNCGNAVRIMERLWSDVAWVGGAQ